MTAEIYNVFGNFRRVGAFVVVGISAAAARTNNHTCTARPHGGPFDVSLLVGATTHIP